jgi:hypothetical protein
MLAIAIWIPFIGSNALACRGLMFETKVFLEEHPPRLKRLARYEGRLATFRAQVIELMPESGPDLRGPFSARVEVSEVLDGPLKPGIYTLIAPNSMCDHPLTATMFGFVSGVPGEGGRIDALSFSNNELSGLSPKAK